MKKTLASLLCILLVYYPTGLVAGAKEPIESANDLIKKSYLDLLEFNEIRRFAADEIKEVEARLNEERDAEQARLKKDEDRIEKELKAARRRLEDLNKKASRDDAETQKQRTEIHCEVLRLEAELAKTKTEREKGVPILYQNKFAKLDLIQKWPAIRAGIEKKIEAGRARERRYGNVEDIGIRDLGIENLAGKQHQISRQVRRRSAR